MFHINHMTFSPSFGPSRWRQRLTRPTNASRSVDTVPEALALKSLSEEEVGLLICHIG
jgi:hypothetical protein